MTAIKGGNKRIRTATMLALALSLTVNRLNRIFKKELESIYRRFT